MDSDAGVWLWSARRAHAAKLAQAACDCYQRMKKLREGLVIRSSAPDRVSPEAIAGGYPAQPGRLPMSPSE